MRGGWGLGFGIWGLGSEVWGLGAGVWGLEFGVWGLGNLSFRRVEKVAAGRPSFI